MMLARQRMLLLTLLMCGLPLVLLMACGAASDNSKTSNKNAVTINAYDNYFDPKTINVSANQPVEVTFVNKGTNVHIVEIKGLVAETTMQPGEKKTFTITPQQRSYKLYDELYVSKGMKGAFTDTDKATSTNNTQSDNAQNAKVKGAVETYRQYVIQQTDGLVTSTQQLNDAINAGDLNKAKHSTRRRVSIMSVSNPSPQVLAISIPVSMPARVMSPMSSGPVSIVSRRRYGLMERLRALKHISTSC